MPKRRVGIAPQTIDQVIMERIGLLEREIKVLKQAAASHMQSDSYEVSDVPFPWEILINWPGGHRPAHPYDAMTYYHPGRTDQESGHVVPAGWKSFKGYAVQSIKAVHDKKNNKVENGVFRFVIDETLDDMNIVRLRAFNGTVGGGACTLQLENVTRGLDLTTAGITIPGGTISSYGNDPIIDEGGSGTNPNNRVHENDIMWINITAASGKGAGLFIVYA